ncbi:MAG: hypothetical protein DSZ06_04845 [Sulfurospirillum sp.]|nr:MAG: hypothetical protein DSZ06_04845 [Sulfurospirillum sp.]
MKKILVILGLLGTLLSADILGTIGLGYSRGDNDGNYVTAFGQANFLAGIGIRLEYTKNVDEHKSFSKEDVSRYGVFATYTFSMLPVISITPKAGLVKTDGEFSLKEVAGKLTSSKTRFTYGLEIDYDMNSQFSLFVGYTDYGKKLDIKDVDTKEMDKSNYMVGFKLHI